VLVGVLVVAAIAVFAAIQANGDDSKATPPDTAKASVAGIAPPGSQAPDFDLARLRGPGRLRLADFQGKPLVVNFWASYCIPCRKEFPAFAALQKKYRAQGLQIVGINFKDLVGDAQQFAKQHHATWDLARDGDDVGRSYGVRAIPQTFFINSAGKIVSRFYGAPATDKFDAQVRRIVTSKHS
jgi:cytochrome c biogenesis protein CcmG/thiol:disulfide interchange protein DsbE